VSTARIYALHAGGAAPRGWERLWDRDRWPHDLLPTADPESEQRGALRFDGIEQPWLRAAAKRWTRARLLSGTTFGSMRVYVRDLVIFGDWLATHAPEVSGPAAITRAVLEDYLLWARCGMKSSATRRRHVSAVRQFLSEQADDGLAGLPRGAVIHVGEIPSVNGRPPRGIEKPVFDQLIDPANLALLPTEKQRTIVLLLAHTGLRVSSLVTLARDALEIGSDGHPYLRYRNLKFKRETIMPIAPQLSDQIRRQQAYLNDAYGPDGTRYLLPNPPQGERGHQRGHGGERHIATHSIGRLLKAYVRKANIRGSDGKLALELHPHLFRHHLATSLVNDRVPLPVIQRILDHASIQMTSLYAQVNDETVKRELIGWQQRVNIRGERIALAPDSPLAQAAWMKDHIARAKQALPNGYCGLPLVQTCPHPNACLSCENFLTDASYRPIHEHQLGETRRLQENAERNGQARLVELLQRDQDALSRILTGLDELEASALSRPDECVDPVDLVDLAGPPA
jgi:integrase